jgi:hypothetical protein
MRALLVGDATDVPPGPVLERLTILAEALEATRLVDASEVLAGIERHVDLSAAHGGEASTVQLTLSRALAGLPSTGGQAAVARARAATALAALGDPAGAKRQLEDARRVAVDDALALRTVNHAAAKAAFLAGEAGVAVAILNATVLPDDPRESIDALLILATEGVGVDGREGLARGLECVERAEARLGELGEDPVLRLRCAKARFFCFYLAGRYREAAAEAERAAVLARRLGLRYEECAHLHNAGEQYLRLGDEAGAREALAASQEMARDIGADGMRLHDEALLAYLDGYDDRLVELADGFRTSGDAWHELHVRYWHGRLLAARGLPGARVELTRALEIARSLEVRLLVDDCEGALASLRLG